MFLKRVSYSGSTAAFQAAGTSSILVTRTKKNIFLCNVTFFRNILEI